MTYGKILIVQFWTKVEITETLAKKLLYSLTQKTGMTPMGDTVIRTYPAMDNRGGVGLTAFQPFVESFAALDTWPEQEGRAVLFFYSCKYFDNRELVSLLKESLAIKKMKYNIVDL